MERGWVPLWRKVEDSAVFQNDALWQLWCLILIRATHKPQVVPTKTGSGDTLVTLEPGQVIYGRNSFAKALRCPPGSLPKRINKLLSLGNITIKGNTHFSIITVANWDAYIASTDTRKQARNRQGTSREHIQECKELENVKKDQNLSAAEDAAMKIVSYYEKEVREERSSRYRARKNVLKLLKGGMKKEVLWECVNLYANDKDNKDPQFRKVAGNFFGQDAVFRNYLDEAQRIVEVEYAAKG